MLPQADRSLRSRSGLAVNQARSQTQLMIAFALWMKLRTCMAQVSSIVGQPKVVYGTCLANLGNRRRHLNVCSRPEVPLRNRRSRSRRISHDVIRAGCILIEVEVVTVQHQTCWMIRILALEQIVSKTGAVKSVLCSIRLIRRIPTQEVLIFRMSYWWSRLQESNSGNRRSLYRSRKAKRAQTYGSKQCWLPTCRHPDCRSLLCSRSVSPVGSIASWSLCSSGSDKKSPALHKERAAHSSLLSARQTVIPVCVRRSMAGHEAWGPQMLVVVKAIRLDRSSASLPCMQNKASPATAKRLILAPKVGKDRYMNSLALAMEFEGDMYLQEGDIRATRRN
ncbi:hypothetical protein KC354_g134 [Hortaea werneckii]|nr:hypothetical protein KC354_g134 [Hortaea werneckii]